MNTTRTRDRRIACATILLFLLSHQDVHPAAALGSCEWPANASHIQCDMDLGHQGAAATPTACASACCANPKCAAWQWGNSSCGASSGCGCWLGHKNVDGKPTGCRNSAAWIGGSRTPPDNSPPVPAPAQPNAHSSVPPEGALLWPKPQRHTIGGTLLRVDADAFLFSSGPASAVIDATTDARSKMTARQRARETENKRPAGTLAGAFERYRAICFPPTSVVAPNAAPGLPVLTGLAVVVASADETLGMDTSEKYSLTIPHAGGNASLTADTVYGAIRGLETFSQMLQPDLTILEQSVDDWPRFPFRAVLIDTGRHFLPVPLIEAHIDAMAYNKMNVLHWHIVDMPSFPFVSERFPNLSKVGAFDPQHQYSPSDVAGIVDYARARGVRVIPEFDSPGHTFPSWGKGGPPGLLTSCSSPITDDTGPLRVDRPQTYEFLEGLLGEVAEKFPDEVFHGGGDEVSFGCWESNAEVKQWMQTHGMGANFTLLNNYYMTRLLEIIDDAAPRGVMNKTAMFWRPGAADTLTQSDIPAGTIFDV